MTKDMLDMAKICVKQLKYLRNYLKMWEMAKMFGKMAQIHGASLKYLRNGISMLQMT